MVCARIVYTKPPFNVNEIYISDMCRFQHAWLTYQQNNINLTKILLSEIKHETIYRELAHIFHAEILDHTEKNVSAAINHYLEFLELYPNSIYYDEVRLRLRELAS